MAVWRREGENKQNAVCQLDIYTSRGTEQKKKTNSPNITDGTNETVKLDTTTALTLCFLFLFDILLLCN